MSKAEQEEAARAMGFNEKAIGELMDAAYPGWRLECGMEQLSR